MLFFAEEQGAPEAFEELARAWWAEFELRVREIPEFAERPLAPDLQLVRVSIEAGWLHHRPSDGRYYRDRSTGEVGDSGLWNPLGIKKGDAEIRALQAEVPPNWWQMGHDLVHVALSADAEIAAGGAVVPYNHRPRPHPDVVAIIESDTWRMFERPATPQAGAHLGHNHTSMYLGLPALSPLNSRAPQAKAVAEAWRAKHGRWPERISDWGNAPTGVWATDPSYATKILDRQDRLLAAAASRKARARFHKRS